MRNLFLVSLATAIFSGISPNVLAQKKSPRFIEGIELQSRPKTVALAYAAKEVSKMPVRTKPDLKKLSSAEIEKCNQLQLKYSLIMNCEVEQIKNVPLYNFIDDWYRTRYRYGGTTKKGIDCSSFTGQLVYDVYNYMLPRTAREQFKTTSRINKEDLREGDLVFFNTTGGISHVGVFLSDGYFVHAGSSTGVTISHLDDPYFAKRYLGAGRVDEAPEYEVLGASVL